ncbi:MAG: HPr-rel-A system PqqD family peptide chaperone [Chromatiaceae bacterium]|nr:HPr-rel-A system PqqD family peptide chaperone [Chromatiaceae bacterium]MCF8014243.1 HPr-rel-A system PqqD family peptide chaperone [Chromatiaceae bacterium]
MIESPVRYFCAHHFPTYEWGGEVIIYQSHSAETHYFNSFAKVILTTLSEKPSTLSELHQRLKSYSNDPLCEDSLKGLLTGLEALGLIEVN